MNRTWKQIAKWTFLTLFLSTVLLLPSIARADGEPYVPKTETLYVTDGTISNNWMLTGVKSVKDVTKLKSSSKKTATVSTFDYSGTVYVGVTAKKPGKTTVSFTAKVNGKKKNYKCVVTVKKYALPFSSFKIGKIDAAKQLKTTYSAGIPLKKALKKQKVSFKLKKGWTIRSMEYYNSTDGSGMTSLKNGKKITVMSGKQIQINLEYKDGSVMDLYLFFTKP